MNIAEIKGVTPADVKFFDAIIKPKMRQDNTKVVNPFSGVAKETSPEVATLTDFVYELSEYSCAPFILKKWGVPAGRVQQMFDRARYLILKLDWAVYSAIID